MQSQDLVKTEIELGEFRELLLKHRDRLKAREYRVRDLRELPDLDRYGYDLGDRAVQEDDKNRIAMQSQAQLVELLAVSAALLRMEKGTYGACIACGDEISSGRLRAIPQAPLCTTCAEMQERELRQTSRLTL